MGPPSGWYADPAAHADMRYWSGDAWTDWVIRDGSMVSDPLSGRRPLHQSDAAHLRFVTEVLLPEAEAQYLIDRQTSESLADLVARMTAAINVPPRPEAAAPPAVWDTLARPEPVLPHPSAGPTGPAVEPAVVQPEPGAVRRWWARARTQISSDLAVHGLAYLGVLLLFVGAFGLVAFAFAGVDRLWRPVAEATLVVVPFTAAIFLLRRGAEVAGRALEVGGGLLLPIMVVTAFLDGAPVPPDLTGVPLVGALTASTLVVAVGYAWWSSRHPTSTLRFLVAPVLWLGAGLLVMGVGRAIPSGQDVASVTAAESTAMAVMLAVTVWAARLRPAPALSAPTVRAAVPGAFVVSVMAVLTWFAEGFPPVPVAVTGVVGIAILTGLDELLPSRAVELLQPVWWTVTAVALFVAYDPGPAGAIAAAGFVALVELQWLRGGRGQRAPDVLAMSLSATGATAAVLLSTQSPWWGFGVALVAAAWAFTRRLRPFAIPLAGMILDGATGLLVVLATIAFADAAQSPALALAGASGVMLLGSDAARFSALRRDPDDKLWSMVWPAFVGLEAVVIAGLGFAEPSDTQMWELVAATALLAPAVATHPVIPAALRPWPTLAFVAWSWVLACSVADISPAWRGSVLAVAALLVVVLAHVRVRGAQPVGLGSLGLSGHVLAVLAPFATDTGWALVFVTAMAAIGFAVTTQADFDDGSPVGALLAKGNVWLRHLPPGLALAGVPLTVTFALDQPAVALPSAWVLPIALGATALLYADASHLRAPARLRTSLVWVGSALAVLAPVLATTRLAAVSGLGVLIVATLTLTSARRPPVMVWLAWAAWAPLAALLTLVARPSTDELTATSAALVGVGGVLLLAGRALDVHGRAWVPRWRLENPTAVPMVVVGAVEAFTGLVIALALVPATPAGWIVLSLAAVLLTAAILTRVGALSLAVVVLAWVAAGLLDTGTFVVRPWAGLLAATIVLLAAGAATRWHQEQWWARWDLALLAAAHLPAGTALIAALDFEYRPLVVVLVGVLALAVAGWFRRTGKVALPYLGVGMALVLLGAVDAGPGWTAGALLVLAVVLSLIAASVRDHGWRRILQLAGALSAAVAWQQATVWFAWSGQTSVDVTVLGASALALLCALDLRVFSSVRDWPVVWGSVASLVAVVSAVLGLGAVEGQPAWAQVAGLGIVTFAWGIAGQLMDRTLVRTGAAGLLVLTEVAGFVVADSTPTVRMTVLALTAAVAAAVSLAGRMSVPLLSWQGPVLGLSVAAAAGSLLVALFELPDLSLLVLALLVAAAVSATTGVVLSSLWPTMLAPLFACGSWMAFAAESLSPNPQWYTAPMGLALLVIVALLRIDARLRGHNPSTRGIVVLELVGIAFLVGSSFVQAVTESLAYVAVALVLGAAVAGWGVLTRVRRRVAAGVLIVLAAAVVLLVVPLVRLLPAWQGTGLWLLLLAAGVGALVAATMLEKGRSALRNAVDRVTRFGKDWE